MSESEYKVPDGEIVIVVEGGNLLRDIRVGRDVKIHIIHHEPAWAPFYVTCPGCSYHSARHVHRNSWTQDARHEAGGTE